MKTPKSFAGFTLPRLRGINAELARPLARRLDDARAFRRQYGRAGLRMAGPYQCRQFATASALGFYLDDSATMPGLRYTLGDEFDCGGPDAIAALVLRLPHGRGFLAGWTMGDHMASEVSRDIIEDETGAMRAAQDAAEREAEHQQRYGEARAVADKLDDHRAALRAAHGEARGLVAVMRELPQTAASRAALCDMVRLCRERMAAALAAIDEARAVLADYAAAGVEV